jgi:hypothetical protein
VPEDHGAASELPPALGEPGQVHVASQQLAPPVSLQATGLSGTQQPAPSELRYATMLDVIHADPSSNIRSERPASKLVGDTYPLSALLRKDLKHKVPLPALPGTYLRTC